MRKSKRLLWTAAAAVVATTATSVEAVSASSISTMNMPLSATALTSSARVMRIARGGGFADEGPVSTRGGAASNNVEATATVIAEGEEEEEGGYDYEYVYEEDGDGVEGVENEEDEDDMVDENETNDDDDGYMYVEEDDLGDYGSPDSGSSGSGGGRFRSAGRSLVARFRIGGSGGGSRGLSSATSYRGRPRSSTNGPVFGVGSHLSQIGGSAALRLAEESSLVAAVLLAAVTRAVIVRACAAWKQRRTEGSKDATTVGSDDGVAAAGADPTGGEAEKEGDVATGGDSAAGGNNEEDELLKPTDLGFGRPRKDDPPVKDVAGSSYGNEDDVNEEADSDVINLDEDDDALTNIKNDEPSQLRRNMWQSPEDYDEPPKGAGDEISDDEPDEPSKPPPGFFRSPQTLRRLSRIADALAVVPRRIHRLVPKSSSSIPSSTSDDSTASIGDAATRERELTDEIQTLLGRIESVETDRDNFSKEHESSLRLLRESQSQTSRLDATNAELRDQIAAVERNAERSARSAASAERRRARDEMAMVRLKIREVLDRERSLMRAQVEKATSQVKELILRQQLVEAEAAEVVAERREEELVKRARAEAATMRGNRGRQTRVEQGKGVDQQWGNRGGVEARKDMTRDMTEEHSEERESSRTVEQDVEEEERFMD